MNFRNSLNDEYAIKNSQVDVREASTCEFFMD